MDIKATLNQTHSKKTTMEIVDYIGKDANQFEVLMNCFFSDDNRLSQRASWPVGFCGESHPQLIYPYLKRMIAQLKQPVHNAIKRNTVRILQEIEIPQNLFGEVVDICFRFLDDPKEAIAVRVFSMSVLYKIVQKEPDLANELRIVIEDHYEHGTAGFKSRGKKILKAIAKLESET